MKAFGVELPDWFVAKLPPIEDNNSSINEILGLVLADYLKRNAPCAHPHYEVKYSWKDTEPPITSNKVCTTCNQCIE